MQISQEHKNQMQAIIAKMRQDGVKCLKDFQCYTSSLEKLCKVKGIGPFDSIQCVNDDAGCCGLSFTVPWEVFCKCPLRRYICANFHR